MPRTVLVLAPHTDDGELGAGGTIRRLVSEGATVFYLAFSRGATEAGEVLRAVTALGVRPQNLLVKGYHTRQFHGDRQSILQDLVDLRDVIDPDLVIGPSCKQRHQDHQVIAAEMERAFPGCSVLTYELPRTELDFRPACFWALDEEQMLAKVRALACYKSQCAKPYMRAEVVWALAVVRGLQAGCRFAEAFEVLRWLNR